MKAKTIFTASLFLFVAMALSGDKPDFTGTWSLDQEKSQLGEFGGRFLASKMTVKQVGDSLTIERVYKREGQEDMLLVEKLSLDGKESTSQFRNSPRVSTANWADEGKTLKIDSKTTFEREGNTFEMQASELWALSEEGKVLTINSTRTSPRGETKTVLVFAKE